MVADWNYQQCLTGHHRPAGKDVRTRDGKPEFIQVCLFVCLSIIPYVCVCILSVCVCSVGNERSLDQSSLEMLTGKLVKRQEA